MQEKDKINGETAAKYFSFYSQKNNNLIKKELPLNRVPYLVLYKENKKNFDYLCELFHKNNLDVIEYIKFFNLNLKKNKTNIRTDLFDIFVIKQFIDHLKIQIIQKHIAQQIVKTAKFIASKSIEMGYSECKSYIKYLILNNKLSNYYLAGYISKYYLAMIPNIKKIIQKLDNISQDELFVISDRHEKYFHDAKEAYENQTGECLNVIYLTNFFIDKILKK